jgi:hypothetical protein
MSLLSLSISFCTHQDEMVLVAQVQKGKAVVVMQTQRSSHGHADAYACSAGAKGAVVKSSQGHSDAGADKKLH